MSLFSTFFSDVTEKEDSHKRNPIKSAFKTPCFKFKASLLVAVFLLSFCLSGCESATATETVTASESEVTLMTSAPVAETETAEVENLSFETSAVDNTETEVEKIETTEMKTIAPPEDGWTWELLNQVIYINGKQVSLPCTIKDLGEGFTFEPFSDNSAYIYYRGKQAFMIKTKESNGTFNEDTLLVKIGFFSTINESLIDDALLISINDVSINDSLEKLLCNIGNNNVSQDNTVYAYELDGSKKNNLDQSLVFNVHQNKIVSITINYKEEF